MELAEALQDAFYILEEERVRPTLSYRYVAKEWPREMKWQESDLRKLGYSCALSAVCFSTAFGANHDVGGENYARYCLPEAL